MRANNAVFTGSVIVETVDNRT